MDKREIIFEIPNSDYRLVCRFNYKVFVSHVWYCYIQEKRLSSFWKLFGRKVFKWDEIDYCWFDGEIETMEKLHQKSFKFFEETIVIPANFRKKSIETALNLK